MRRRRFVDGKEVARTFGSHLMFVVVLTLGTLIRFLTEDNDGNTIMFAIVLAVGIILAVSLFNQFIIDLFNDLNDKWTVINYCVPAVVVLLVLLVFRIPVESFDLVIFPALILMADLVMYAMMKGTS